MHGTPDGRDPKKKDPSEVIEQMNMEVIHTSQFLQEHIRRIEETREVLSEARDDEEESGTEADGSEETGPVPTLPASTSSSSTTTPKDGDE